MEGDWLYTYMLGINGVPSKTVYCQQQPDILGTPLLDRFHDTLQHENLHTITYP